MTPPIERVLKANAENDQQFLTLRNTPLDPSTYSSGDPDTQKSGQDGESTRMLIRDNLLSQVPLF